MYSLDEICHSCTIFNDGNISFIPKSLLSNSNLDDLSELKPNEEYEKIPIEKDVFEQYVAENTTDKGIKLIRRYYGIIAKK